MPEKARRDKIASRQAVFMFKTPPKAHSVYFPAALHWEKNFAALIYRR
jgi:hypothetical protein